MHSYFVQVTNFRFHSNFLLSHQLCNRCNILAHHKAYKEYRDLIIPKGNIITCINLVAKNNNSF